MVPNVFGKFQIQHLVFYKTYKTLQKLQNTRDRCTPEHPNSSREHQQLAVSIGRPGGHIRDVWDNVLRVFVIYKSLQKFRDGPLVADYSESDR